MPYCILWLATFVEGPITLLAAGAGVAIGKLLLLPAYLTVVIGNLTADLGWYGLGRFGKLEWLERIGRAFGIERRSVDKLEEDVKQYAPRMIFLSKLTVGLPIPTLIAIGLNRISIKRWGGLWILSELIKSALFVMAGYLYAGSIQNTYGYVRIALWVVTIALILGITFFFRLNDRKKKANCHVDGFAEIANNDDEGKLRMKFMKKKAKGLILIPAYNEERSIETVVRKAVEYLPVLVVDDGSSDHTAWQASMAGAEVISHEVNQGKGTSLKDGIQYALEWNYDFVITLDADGQHDPLEVEKFLDKYAETNADLIIGARNFSMMPTVRRVSNTLGTRLFSWAVGQPITDNQSGYRLISRRLLEVLHESKETGYEFEVEMIVYCIARQFSMKWVPIRTIYGDEKSHISPLKHASKFVQVSLRARRLLKEKKDLFLKRPSVGQVK